MYIFFNFTVGNTELIIRQGITSNDPIVEVLRHPVIHYHIPKTIEHIAPISEGFYISFRSIFNSNSSLAIMYSAFNYKGSFRWKM